MARSSTSAMRGMPLAGIAIGGILAGMFLPKLLRSGRLAAKAMGGMTYRSGAPGSSRPQADPAHGRPA